ncbi:hypothetical protein L873DRAFT_1785965 [Choiromyces venosus 120613-1]|uniref:Uncharacterized protein n=1 Tax=Choiromyces venosus 120613-1 TaxID=1336337 RepID=A0A3N4K8F9_9PEZI|nr:hypothetical protein L873DRAFT_1785965 [Choiromyces venosus 120613-1]
MKAEGEPLGCGSDEAGAQNGPESAPAGQAGSWVSVMGPLWKRQAAGEPQLADSGPGESKRLEIADEGMGPGSRAEGVSPVRTMGGKECKPGENIRQTKKGNKIKRKDRHTKEPKRTPKYTKKEMQYQKNPSESLKYSKKGQPNQWHSPRMLKCSLTPSPGSKENKNANEIPKQKQYRECRGVSKNMELLLEY